MKFVHAADIHLDSPLHGLSAYPGAPAQQLRNATREAFVRLVDRTIEEEADFLVLAGDLYDGAWRDHNTGIFFSEQMGRLRREGIRAYVAYGNHDAESEITRKLALPDNVFTFDHRKAQTYRIDELKVALHGQSFREKAVVDNLASAYPAPVPGYFNVGVLHTALEGYTAHPHYAPCSLAELNLKGYDYWALGHVHEYQMWDEQATIVFPGNLQGRSVRETGRRGAVLVEVENGRATVERLFIDVLRWERIEVDVSACTAMDEVAQAVGLHLEALLEADAATPRAVRVVLHGRTPAHAVLFGGGAHLRAEVLSQIAILDNDRLWLEKVRAYTEPPSSPADYAARMDAVSDLQQILGEALGDAAFLERLSAELRPFLAKLPPGLAEDMPLVGLARRGEIDGLIEAVSPSLLAKLAATV